MEENVQFQSEFSKDKSEPWVKNPAGGGMELPVSTITPFIEGLHSMGQTFNMHHLIQPSKNTSK